VAGGFPIKRAIGVELDDALTRVARENAERARPR